MAILTPHQKAALQFGSHISLTANAGSGKTFILSRRYIEIVLKEGISLRNIAAITFTDKAASELYKKIALQIEERLSKAEDKAVEKKLENMRRQLVSANISTIHSFCIDILREYPVEARLDANFSPIDEELSTELIELSVEETIKAAVQSAEEAESLRYLVRFFSSKNTLARELISLIKSKKNVLKIAGTLYSADAIKAAEFFKEKFEELVPKILLDQEDKILNTISIVNDAVLKVKPDNAIALDMVRLIKNIETAATNNKKLLIYVEIKNLISTQKGTLKKTGYTQKVYEDYIDEINFIEIFFENLNYLDLSDNSGEVELELARFGGTIVHFFNKALANYINKKNENSFLDYEDILLFTQEILNKENVRESLSEKFKYIMIDEYQDTNELQYNIFLPILDKLKKGNLFVVGDEKQSIYMFRDAELEVFNRTKTDISVESGPQYLLTLPDSFRMAPVIGLFTNELFKNLFANPNPIYNEVRHSDLVCARSDEIMGGVEIMFAGNNDVKEQETEQEEEDPDNAEAEMIARRIIKLLFEDQLPKKMLWNDVAVLCRKRKSFTELEKAFVKYGVPFTILGGKGFYQRQSIYDVYNYFSFLLDIKNDTALIGILRSPFFSISDSVIFEVSLTGGNGFWEKLVNYSNEKKLLTGIVKIINENIKLASSYDITPLLRKILSESNLLAVVSSKPNGIQEVANINKLIKLSINFSAQGFKTLYDYVNFLKESIEETEDEAQAVLTEESDSVKIMTIHQSKGLEFPAVFLYKCNDKSGSSSVKSKSLSINKEFGILTKVPVGENYFSDYQSAPINGIANIIAKRKTLAENKRLFYVAVTRAINFLFISSSYKKEYKYDHGSFTGMLKDGLRMDFDSAEYKLSSKLKFLQIENNEYKNIEKEIDLFIPILKHVEEPIVKPEQTILKNKKDLAMLKIQDIPEEEIISATKVAVFNQCPVKYQLTYEFGFGSLFHNYRSWLLNNNLLPKIKSNYEYNSNEEYISEENDNAVTSRKLKNYADIKGRVIHEILENSITSAELDSVITALIEKEFSVFEKNENLEKELGAEIKSDVKKFYDSKVYASISVSKDFKNEFEIYIRERNYFLYGIIDKLMFDGKRAVIIDYKTDDISTDDLNEKAKAYFTQLRFYAYIVSNLFPLIEEFQLRLIFIKHPDEVMTILINQDELKTISDEISKMVELVRKNIFAPNFEHCKSCYFALNNLCIKN